jgi:hypothetical protein
MEIILTKYCIKKSTELFITVLEIGEEIETFSSAERLLIELLCTYYLNPMKIDSEKIADLNKD